MKTKNMFLMIVTTAATFLFTATAIATPQVHAVVNKSDPTEEGAWWHGDLDPIDDAECHHVENDADGFGEAIICYGEKEAWTCASDDGALWYCWAIDFRWETDCPTCGAPSDPVRAVERIVAETVPTEDLPSCAWRPSSNSNECDLVCNGDYKARCIRTATGVVGCSAGDDTGITGKGTLPCEVLV